MKLKLQTQVVSVVLITGVALVLAGTAYYWGIPLLEKTQKSVELEDSERFLRHLVSAIISTAETGDVNKVEAELKGKFIVDAKNDEIRYEVMAPTVYYPVTSYVPLDDMPPFKKDVVIFGDGEVKEVPGFNSSLVNKCFFVLDCENKVLREHTEAQCAFEGDSSEKDEFADGSKIKSEDGSVEYLVITKYCDSYSLGYVESSKEEKIAGIKGVNKPLVMMVKALADMEKENFLNIYRVVSREIVDGDTNTGMYIDLVVENGDKIEKEGGNVVIVISRESSTIEAGASSLGGDLTRIKVKVEIR